LGGRNAREAFGNHVDLLRAALGCVTHPRLTVSPRSTPAVDTTYSIALNDLDPVALSGGVPLMLTAGQFVRVEALAPDDPRGLYEIRLTQYLYALSTADDREILAFHWTPEAREHGVVTTPHLHIGPAISAGQTTVRTGDLHKVHLPTGRVSIEAVIRLAITEFGVIPKRRNWERVLRRTEDAFGRSEVR
jgi:hypothetical protein